MVDDAEHNGVASAAIVTFIVVCLRHNSAVGPCLSEDMAQELRDTCAPLSPDCAFMVMPMATPLPS
jgi:hypothetical protein